MSASGCSLSVPSLLPEASKAYAQVLVSVIARSPGLSTLPRSVLKAKVDMLHQRPHHRSDATLCAVGHLGLSQSSFWVPLGTAAVGA